MKRRERSSEDWENQRKKLIGLGEHSFQKSYFPALQNELAERKRTEIELRKTNRALRTITECNQAIVRATNVPSFIEKACKIIREINEYPLIWIGAIQIGAIPETTEVQFEAIAHSDELITPGDLPRLIELETEGKNSPAAGVIHKKKPYILRRLSGKPSPMNDWRIAAQNAGFRSVIVLPLMIKQQVLGVLFIHASNYQTFDTLEVKQLSELAGDLANGIETLRERTLRQQAEKKLLDSEARYRSFVQNFQGIAYRLGAELSSSFFHGAVEAITGYTEEEFLLKNPPWNHIVHPEDLRYIREFETTDLPKSDYVVEREYRIMRKDGQVRWVHETIQHVHDPTNNGPYTQGSIYDITERKRSEHELYQRNLELTTIASVLSAAATHMNLQEMLDQALVDTLQLTGIESGFILLINEDTNIISLNACKNIPQGLIEKLEEPAGPLCHNICDPIRQDLKVVITREEEAQELFHRPSLLLEGFRFQAIFPMLARNQIMGVMCLLSRRDSPLTERGANIMMDICGTLGLAIQNARLQTQVHQHAIELEKRVLERTAELEAANKELETFAYSVSHDLKAPLRGIDGYSRLLLENYEDRLGEDGKNFLQSIRKATLLMHQLINDLLEYSRLERRQHVTTEINPENLVEALINEYEAFSTHKINISVNVDSALISVEPEGLAQALRNLIENGIKFTAGVPDPKIEIVGRKKTASFLIWVRDNGIGFDMRYHDRIFDIFQRLHNYDEYPGTGIGLAIVRKAIQRMGGRVWAESTPGAGSTFYIEIPQ